MHVLLISVPIMDLLTDETGREKLTPIAMDSLKDCPPYGVYLLAAILRSSGYQAEVLDFIAIGSLDEELLKNKISTVDLVGISTSSLNWPTAIKCIENIYKIRNDLSIVVGGIHASMFDVYILRTFPVSYVIRGEGEVALISLCKALEKKLSLDAVQNLTYKDNDGQIKRNSIARFLTSSQIAELPAPAYDLLPDQVYHTISIESSRGCPYDCAFCSTLYRRSWRPTPVNVFVDKVEAVSSFIDRIHSNTIQIVDDEWSVSPKRCIDVCKEFTRRNIKSQIVFDARATDLQNEQFLDTVKPYINRFLIGAECGYDEGLKRIGKGTSTSILASVAKNLAKHRIAHKCNFSFVIGFPWESKAGALKTIEFASNLFWEYGVRIMLQWYCMIPGSRYWDEAYGQEKVTATHYDDFGFFQNLYLFRTGVQLLPSEILDISTRVNALKGLAELSYPGRNMILFQTPMSIAKYYSHEALKSEQNLARKALDNLRDLSGQVSL